MRCYENRTRGTTLASRARLADNFFSRARGLLFTRSLDAGSGLYLVPCKSIHMFGMAYPIDAVFLDRDGIVVGLAENIQPGQVSSYFKTAAGCLELPAGLIGDDYHNDNVEKAAARELEEETGYRASHIQPLGEYCSSPGMVAESFTLVRATGLSRVGEGGGIEGEDIVVHHVPRADVVSFIEEKRDEGVGIDVRLLLLLGSEYLR